MSAHNPWEGNRGNRGGNSTNPGDNGPWNWRNRGTRPTLLPNETSYLVATCYLSFLTVVAVVMATRSKTRLRIFALFITFLGLTIAVIGYLRSIYVLGPQWFWCWNFLGEGIGVVAMAAIIVSVGSGFYPMTHKRSVLWMGSMGLVCIYAAFAAVNIGFYVHQKILPRPIMSDDLQTLREIIFSEYNATRRDLAIQRRQEFEVGKVSTQSYNATMAGFIFDQPAQALDLCLRLTVGPIFMLPAPAFLFRFYRQHFKKFRGAGSSGNGGSGGKTTDSSNAQNDSRSYQAGSSRTGGIAQFQPSRLANTPRGSLNINRDSHYLDSPSKNQRSNDDDTKNEKSHNLGNPGNACLQGRLKFFQSRDRGLSVESSRVLSGDFDYEEQTSNYSEDRPDSFHQYYNNMDTHHPLRDSVTLGDQSERHEQEYKSPDIAMLPAAHVRSTSKNDYPTERPVMDAPAQVITPGRQCNDKESSTNQQTVPEDDTSFRSSASTPEPNNTSPTVSPPHAVANIEQLTGLQRQLAEHRADLLPRVMAVKEYHEDLATAEALELGLKPTSVAYDHDVVLKDANSLSAINNFFDPSPSKAPQTEDHRPLSPEIRASGLTSSPLPPIPVQKLRKPASSTALNKDSTAKLSKEPKPKDKKILSAFSKAITGNGSKSGHSHSHSNEGNNLDLMDGDKDGHGSFEANRGAAVFAASPATVKELAEASVSSFGQSGDGTKQSYIYSDPYEDKTGFKKSFQGQDRQALMQSMPKALCPSTGSYSRIDCRTTASADAAKLRGSQSAGSLSIAKAADVTSQSSNRKIPPVPKDSRPTVSKKSGHHQSASRSSRSKSDAPYRPSAEVIRGPSTELPINTYRSPPLAPAVLPQPAKTSLSPPPRQSWRRSKSFKGNSPPLIAAIDTKLANEDASERTEPTSNSANSASLTSSSQSSPTVGSYSRENTLESHYSKETGEPLSPPVPGFYQGSGSRANSLDISSLSKGTSFGSGSSSTVSSPAHRGINRQQRSVDNLASAYYYKRAAELNNSPSSSITPSSLPNRSKHSQGSSSSSSSSMRDPSSIMMPSSLASPSSPPSPKLANNPGVVSYFARHQAQASISSSPATSPGLGPGSGPIDRAVNGRNSPPYDGVSGSSGRTGSFTKQNTIMAEDPWTMALINRAQAQSSSGSQIPQPPSNADIYSRPSIARTASE
ncbi:hypothetical protein BGZ82_007315 [Podila clonocystis]|nr:hypothetical protein BGZ82_007315 [Podila clonocystis]